MYPDQGLAVDVFLIIMISAVYFKLILTDKYSSGSLQIMNGPRCFIVVEFSRIRQQSVQEALCGKTNDPLSSVNTDSAHTAPNIDKNRNRLLSGRHVGFHLENRHFTEGPEKGSKNLFCEAQYFMTLLYFKLVICLNACWGFYLI